MARSLRHHIARATPKIARSDSAGARDETAATARPTPEWCGPNKLAMRIPAENAAQAVRPKAYKRTTRLKYSWRDAMEPFHSTTSRSSCRWTLSASPFRFVSRARPTATASRLAHNKTPMPINLSTTRPSILQRYDSTVELRLRGQRSWTTLKLVALCEPLRQDGRVLPDPEQCGRLAFALKMDPHEMQSCDNRTGAVLLDCETAVVERLRKLHPAGVIRPKAGREDDGADLVKR